MLVSVIIPTYKPGKYIFKCLESISKQTIDKHLYQVIVVLNGCNEPYYSTLLNYLEQLFLDKNVQLLRTEVSGVSNARNMGLDYADGEYITFVDDDDWVSETYLEKMLDKTDTYSIVEANVLQVEQHTHEIMPHFLTTAYKKAMNREKLTFYACRSFLSSACCKLIPKRVIQNDRFNTKYLLGEDSLFMFQISKRIQSIRIASPQAVYYVLYRQSSASRKKYSYPFRVKLALKLVGSYISVYVTDMRNYDFVFFLTRIVATLRKLFQKSYQ